jgi:arylsulfatase A-like enzyme
VVSWQRRCRRYATENLLCCLYGNGGMVRRQRHWEQWPAVANGGKVNMGTRPNILLIILHDLGTRLGCYGETSIQTPAVDGLASEGVLFRNHFCTAPFCSPSRGAIFTGKYPHFNGLMGLVNLGWDLPEHNTTLAEILGAAGYDTFLFGLQHEKKNPAHLGFHKHYVPETDSGKGIMSCENIAPVVLDFLMQRGKSRENPFYARVGFFEVHRRGAHFSGYGQDDPDQVAVPPYLKDTSGAREDLAMFHGCIRFADSAVGDLLEALDESDLSENTIVVFTTDHGIAFPRAKATLYDPGIRTTLIIRWPDGIDGKKTYSELISNVDLLPSMLDMADVSVPEDVQGRSFRNLLRGRDYVPNEWVFAEKNTSPGDIKRCIRTQRYKYIRNYDDGPELSLPTDIEQSLTRRDMGDEHLKPRPPIELYDLQEDPGEIRNLAGCPELSSVEDDMASRLQRFMEETDDPILRGLIPRPSEEAEIINRIWSSIKRHTAT